MRRYYGPVRGCFSIFLMLILACSTPSTLSPHGSLLSLTARDFLGTPYQLGGSSRNGMDCSGLVVRVFFLVENRRLPHSSAALFRMGKPVPLRSLLEGDLVFFRENRGHEVSHVGIYLGRMKFIHASNQGVVISSLNREYYQSRFAGGRRL